MLTLFKPWRTGRDLRYQDQTWSQAYQAYEFPSRYKSIIQNINLRYECLDARDDYRAQMKNGVHPEMGFAGGFDHDPQEDVDIAPEWTWMQETPAVYLDAGDEVASKLSKNEQRKLDSMKEIAALLQDIGWDKPPAESTSLDKGKDYRWGSLDAIGKAHGPQISPPDDTVAETNSTQQTAKELVHIADKSYLLRRKVSEVPEIRAHMAEAISKFKLNYEQEKAFRIVANHSTDPYSERLKMYIGGMGGTGKSQVLKALTHFFALRKESHRLIVVAPTGSAAALLGGMTYHAAFGINEKSQDTNPGTVKARLTGVDYVFFDEVSMLSAHQLYKISARLCLVRNNHEQCFGGLNMILAGDFAQLPPVVGGEAIALYGPPRPGATAARQQEMIGKSIWHEFTTVVMLKKNMRQVKKGDKAFRAMLENMRYGKCTSEDIKFLRSRISTTLPGGPSICDDNFRNVSVITTRNALKDTINDMGSKRFALETGQELTYFYADDAIAPESDKSQRPRTKKKVLKRSINAKLQHQLWHQLPHTTSRHVPGRLGLCIGLPALIRINSATELGITNGQEACVYGWKTGTGSRGQPVLEVLFLELSNPPVPVKFSGLPRNVVPVMPTTTNQLLCTLAGGLTVSIDRTQVEVLPNFAMTDFASQGKTRPYNVVDLHSCETHQSMYTALSRGTSAAGTIILRDFNPSIVQKGISGYQRQEFRILALLDEITDLRYNENLPVEIFGIHRKELISSYRNWKGHSYIPKGLHAALKWNSQQQWMEDESEYVPWKFIEDPKPRRKNKQVNNTDNLVSAVGSQSLKRKLDITDVLDDNELDREEPRVKRTKRVLRPINDRDQSWNNDSNIRGAGTVWRNNSCAYDSLMSILYHVWRKNRVQCATYFNWMGNDVLIQLGQGFAQVQSGLATPEQVRDAWQRQMAAEYPQDFTFGGLASVGALIDRMFICPDPIYRMVYRCISCGRTNTQTPYDERLHRTLPVFDLNSNTPPSTTQAWLGAYMDSHFCCKDCDQHTLQYQRHFTPIPGFILSTLSLMHQLQSTRH
ncbi:hypothetical protein NMY22_g5748 [Coprinellus aureogranulatus]|nr:hypothetical protein NMY22_g5748 [Coprinellus aureogranulatus]